MSGKQPLTTVRDQLSLGENLLLTGLGSGWITPAPGTWGSLAALVLVVPLLTSLSALAAAGALAALSVVFTVVGTHVIDRVESRTGLHDAGEIVVDEWVGQWLALLPFAWLGADWPFWLVSFALFRFFDIVKPAPIGWLDQRVNGGWGVMLDDIVAGLFAALVGYLIWSVSL